MRVLIAVDSFKGSMSSMEAGRAAADGIRRVYPEAELEVAPLADGGEGTVEALTEGLGGEKRTVCVTGPLGRPVQCTYGLLPESGTAVIEMAGAAGLTLLEEKERNPLLTTTRGVGEVIRDALRQGCRHFLVGIGGSATNDGGIGMLQALGFEFLDAQGRQVPFGARGLEVLVRISDARVLPELWEADFRIACDVKNPLCGRNGCSAVFGPQKGADEVMVRQMDAWMARYAELAAKCVPGADAQAEAEGAGAAGGLGFAFLTFIGAALEPGVGMILEETGMEARIRRADVVVTGEGRMDGQTAMGKAPVGLAALARRCKKPVLAFAGSVSEEARSCNEEGIAAFFPIVRGAVTLEEAMEPEHARRNMRDTAEQVFRLWKLRDGEGKKETGV